MWNSAANESFPYITPSLSHKHPPVPVPKIKNAEDLLPFAFPISNSHNPADFASFIDATSLFTLFSISEFIFVPYIFATFGAAYDLTLDSSSISPGALIPITSISSLYFIFEHI